MSYISSDFMRRMRESKCHTYSKFFSRIDYVRQQGERYRSRNNALEFTLEAYRVLELAYLQIMSPFWYNKFNYVHQYIDSISVTPDNFFLCLKNTLEDYDSKVPRRELLEDSRIFNVKFINMPSNAQLINLMEQVDAHNTGDNRLDNLLGSMPFHVLQKVTFTYANKTHYCCVMRYVYNLPGFKEEGNDSGLAAYAPSYIVITSNMSDITMGIAYKAICWDALSDMEDEVTRVLEETGDDRRPDYEIWQDFFTDMVATSSSQASSAMAQPYVARFETLLRTRAFKINMQELYDKLKDVVQTPVRAKDNTTEQIKQLHMSITSYEREIIDLYTKIDKLSYALYKNDKIKKSLEVIESELNRLIKDRILVKIESYSDRSNGTDFLNAIVMKFDIPIKLWEQDEARMYIRFKENSVVNSDDYFKFGVALFKAIFIERKIIMHNTCYVEWNLNNGVVGNFGGSAVYNDSFQYMAQIHINKFNCFGNNNRSIVKALKEYNYKEALAYTMQAIMQYNFGDSTVCNNMFQCLYKNNSMNWEGNKNKAFLEYEGLFYTPEDMYNFYNKTTEQLELPSGTATTTDTENVIEEDS